MLASVLVVAGVATSSEAAASGSLKLSAGSTAYQKLSAKRTTVVAKSVITVPSKLPASFGFQFRSSGTSTGYRAVFHVAKDGSVTGGFVRARKSVTKKLGEPISLGFRVSPGEKISIQSTVTSLRKVKLYLRAWKTGKTPPAKWALKRTDSTAKRLQKPGPVYLWATGSSSKLKYKSTTVLHFSAKRAKAIGVAKPKPVGTAVKAPSPPAPPKTETPAPATPAPSKTATPAPEANSSYGVPAGTKLTKVDGDVDITKDGTVLEGVDVHGFVRVKADNVTIKNSIIRGGAAPTSNKALIMNWNGGKNLKIVDTTLVARNPSYHLEGVSGRDYTVQRLDISNVVDAIKVTTGDVTVKDSWFHDPYFVAKGAPTPDGKTHNDGIQIEGGGNVFVSGNVIEGFDNAAVMITQNARLITGVRIESNILKGGQCTINMAEKGKGPLQGVTIAGNKFGPSMRAGLVCPITHPATTKLELAGNTWLSTGAAVVARQTR